VLVRHAISPVPAFCEPDHAADDDARQHLFTRVFTIECMLTMRCHYSRPFILRRPRGRRAQRAQPSTVVPRQTPLLSAQREERVRASHRLCARHAFAHGGASCRDADERIYAQRRCACADAQRGENSAVYACASLPFHRLPRHAVVNRYAPSRYCRRAKKDDAAPLSICALRTLFAAHRSSPPRRRPPAIAPPFCAAARIF